MDSLGSALESINCKNITVIPTSNTLIVKNQDFDSYRSLSKNNEDATEYDRKIYLENNWILIYECTPYFGVGAVERMTIGSTGQVLSQEEISAMVEFWSMFMNWSTGLEIRHLNGPCKPRALTTEITSTTPLATPNIGG